MGSLAKSVLTPVEYLSLCIDELQANHSQSLNITLEHMKMGPDDSYVCLIPPSPESSAPLEEQEEVTPVQSWALLKPLSGRCLYVRLHLTASSSC
jgi:hypothetical protein